MQNSVMVERTKEFVKNNMENDSGHDWWHIYRVWKLARKISEGENANMFIVEMAALLHDLEDWKFHDDEEKQKTVKWLQGLGVDSKDISKIVEIVNGVSFKGAGEKPKELSLEGKIVQDADRLDAMGAIGIARTFVFAGWKGSPIHDPGIKVKSNMTFDAYKKSSSAINHFYEKLLLVKDCMNTKTGRDMAENRHQFMEEYLEQFFKEWDGKE